MRDEREAKAREFSEAQQHIGRLMGVMGFSAQSAEPKPQQPKSARKPKSTARHSHVYDDEDDDSQLIESFESMNSNLENGEPTPKRPRGNRLSYPSQPPVQAKGLPASKSSPLIAEPARHSIRQPLAETDLNSPRKSPPPKSSKSNQPTTGPTDNFEDLDLDMDLEFSRDFLFTSTLFSGPNDK